MPLAKEFLAHNDCFGEEESVVFKDVTPKRAIHAPVENSTPMHIYTATVNRLCALLNGSERKLVKLGGEMGSDWEVERIKTHT